MKHMRNGASGRHTAGRVEIHWSALPPVDGVASVDEPLRTWDPGVPIRDPMQLAEGLQRCVEAGGPALLEGPLAILDAESRRFVAERAAVAAYDEDLGVAP